MDKVAFLIMCHKNLGQVNRLIRALRDDDAVYFVHVDCRLPSTSLGFKGGYE